MPKTEGFTKSGQLRKFFRENPGIYRASKVAHQFKCSSSVVSAVLRELAKNYPRLVEQRGGGRNTLWVVKKLEFR